MRSTTRNHSADNGPWHRARLAAADGIDTWRQWMWPWDAKPGLHRLHVRATGKVLADKAELTKILTYHVADGCQTPGQLASGTAIKTLEGGIVTPAMMSGRLHRQQGARGLRQRADRQRHRLHHRHRADVPVLLTTTGRRRAGQPVARRA